MHVAIVSPEIAPFVGGGIAPVTLATAQTLAGAGHRVDLFAPGHYRRDAARLRALGFPALRHPLLRWHWVDIAPGDDAWAVRWGQAVDAATQLLYAERAPDIVEFQDYLGTGAAAMQSALAGRSPLAASRLVLRLHSTIEFVHAVDGHMHDEPEWRQIYAQEQLSLRAADALLPPTAHVGRVYDAFYSGLELAPSRPLWPAFLREGVADPTPRDVPDGAPLSLAFIGRMQRVKGVVPLVEAVRELPDADLRLVMVGGDTDTAPSGGSMRSHLVELVGNDPRIVLMPARPRHELASVVRDADAVLVPSRWECCPNVALEALAANRPVIGSRVGSLQDMLLDAPAELALDDGIQASLTDSIGTLASDPGLLRTQIAASAPRRLFDRLTAEDDFVSGYLALRDEQRERPTELTEGDAPAHIDAGAALESVAAARLEQLPAGTVLS